MKQVTRLRVAANAGEIVTGIARIRTVQLRAAFSRERIRIRVATLRENVQKRIAQRSTHASLRCSAAHTRCARPSLAVTPALAPGEHGAGKVFAVLDGGKEHAGDVQAHQHQRQLGKELVHVFPLLVPVMSKLLRG